MTLALAEATLAALFFVHLKPEGRWVDLVLAPAGFLALALVLVPDIGMKRPAPPAPAVKPGAISAPRAPDSAA